MTCSSWGRLIKIFTAHIAAFADLTAHTQGREVLFVLSHEIGGVLLEAKNRDSEASCLAMAAMIVRREILQVKISFNGTFAPNCQTDSVPASLTTLLNMIMRGPAMKKDSAESQACLTVAQLLVFNSISRFRDKSDNASGTTHSTNHIRGRECPLPIHAALKIHGATTEKSLVDVFYKLAMCISYDRLLSISSDITNSVIDSIREADFSLYLKAIKEFLPWMFALDSQNCARWLSVHYQDMCELPVKHPDVCAEFRNGAFVVHKTQRLFSSIALDHAHEQVNGLTENPAALRRWMVPGPELSRMVDKFEETISAKESQKHHKQNLATQSAFAKNILNLVSSFEELGNPFKENGEELTALHTKDSMNKEVVHTVRNARKMGEQQCKAFFKERLEDKKNF
ncbi:hypothetical protein ACROYT_G025005 [Oculina patagonica]